MRNKRVSMGTDKIEARLARSLERAQGEIWKDNIRISKKKLSLDHRSLFWGTGQLYLSVRTVSRSWVC